MIQTMRARSGYKALLASLVLCVLPATAQKIAFTYDDLPAHSALPPGESRLEIASKLIAAWQEAKLPPLYGFVNGVRAEEEPLSPPVLKAWRDAHFPLGNHTWSHMNLNAHTLEEFEADALKNEPVLSQRMQGEDWHWFRFPNLAEGNTPEKKAGVREFLAKHNYKIAGVTMSFADYLWNGPYARCVAQKDEASIKQLEESYLAAADESIKYSRGLSQALYGRDIPYVLLMHIGAFDARMAARLIELYKSRGFTFVTLEEAEKDEFYKNDIDLSLPVSPDTLEAAMAARQMPLPPRPKPSIDLDKVCR